MCVREREREREREGFGRAARTAPHRELDGCAAIIYAVAEVETLAELLGGSPPSDLKAKGDAGRTIARCWLASLRSWGEAWGRRVGTHARHVFGARVPLWAFGSTQEGRPNVSPNIWA